MQRVSRPGIAHVTNSAARWSWTGDGPHPDTYRGACARARELGFDVEHFTLRERILSQGHLGRMLSACNIQGIILATHGRDAGLAPELDWNNYATVKIGCYPHQPDVHMVTINPCDIIRLAMQKVIAAGYRRIGFVMHRGWDRRVGHLWMAGYLCEQQTLPPEYHIGLTNASGARYEGSVGSQADIPPAGLTWIFRDRAQTPDRNMRQLRLRRRP